MLTMFLSDESGAVTVDWVVLTASLVGLGLAVLVLINRGIQEPTTGLTNELSADIVNFHDGFGQP